MSVKLESITAIAGTAILAKTALQFSKEIPNLINSVQGGSLIEYTKATRVEPQVLIDNRAAALPYIEDVLYSLLNVFSAYYLQAVALTVNVGKVNVLRLLDTLNPNRSIKSSGAIDRITSLINTQESMQYALPFIGKPVGLEAYKEYGYSQESIEVTESLRRANDLMNDALEVIDISDMDDPELVDGLRDAITTVTRAIERGDNSHDALRKAQDSINGLNRYVEHLKTQNQKTVNDLDAKVKNLGKQLDEANKSNVKGSQNFKIRELQRRYNDAERDHKNALDSLKRAADFEKIKNFKKVNELEAQIKKLQESFSATVSSKSIQEVTESANLSVGKLIEVNVESEGKTASFPVQVRLMASRIDPTLLVKTLTLSKNSDFSFKERYHKWKSGQISFFSDLILCQDMIDKHKKNLIKDTTGFYKSSHDRHNKNLVTSILSKTPSVATASSIIVMTADTARSLELAGRIKLDRFRDREALMEESYLMLLVIIDDKWQQVTIYHKSIDMASEISVREIKRKGNKSGGGKDDSITNMLASLMQGKAAIV